MSTLTIILARQILPTYFCKLQRTPNNSIQKKFKQKCNTRNKQNGTSAISLIKPGLLWNPSVEFKTGKKNFSGYGGHENLTVLAVHSLINWNTETI